MGNSKDGKQVRSVSLDLGELQVVFECLAPTGSEAPKLRMAYWSQGKMLSHPPALTEQQLVILLQKAIRAKVLSPDFLKNLHSEFEI